MKNYIFLFLFSIISNFILAQEAVLCAVQTEHFRIENPVNVPIVTSNNDDTFTLTFPDQSVTDLFADYNVYDFFQTFPNGSQTLQKYYTIAFDSNDLIENIIASVPTSIIQWTGSEAEVYDSPIRTTIIPEFILALDGKSFEVTKYLSTSDECDPFNNNPICNLIDVPMDFNFFISFSWDAQSDMFLMESQELTSCGNLFSVNLAGGNPNELGGNNTLQFWESISATSAMSESSEPCHAVERILFSILDMACSPFNNDSGNFYVLIDSETGKIKFFRTLAIMGYSILELSERNLSVEDDILQNIKLFEKENNPYLQIANLKNQPITIEILNASGQQVLKPKTFEENSLDISNLTTGLYFIRLSNLNNQQKIFKFLKN